MHIRRRDRSVGDGQLERKARRLAVLEEGHAGHEARAGEDGAEGGRVAAGKRHGDGDGAEREGEVGDVRRD